MNKNLFKAIALLSILFGTMLLAVPVTGPVKTWTSGEILTSADLNSTINSLKAAIEGISTATTTSTATATSTSVSSQWATNGTNISYTNGNVGIGTVTPLGTLAVQGTGTGTGVNFQTANSSGTSLITALDNGNVGIGTSSPVNILHVKSSGNVLPTWETTGVNTIYHRFIGTDGNPKAYVGIESSAGTGLIGAGSYALSMTTASTNNLVLATNSTARVTVLGSNGNVGIGTNSPQTTLHVNGQAIIRGTSNIYYTTNTDSARTAPFFVDQSDVGGGAG